MNQIEYIERKTIYAKALKKWGAEAQVVVAVEELSELTKELCKVLRQQKNAEDLVDELADVAIMVEQMRLLFGVNEQVCRRMDEKLERLRRRTEARE